MRVGVLALQGGVGAHRRFYRRRGHVVVELRRAAEVDQIDALVLPGGESTVQAKLLEAECGLLAKLDARIRAGIPTLATCAGAILASRYGWLDIDVERNAYGSQRHSSEAIADDGTRVVMIRAPEITRVGPSVRVLTTLGGTPVLVRQSNVTGATFHPEL